MRFPQLLAGVFGLLGLLWMVPASAVPVSYVWSGSGTFTIDGADYSGGFQLDLSGDTDFVSPAGSSFLFATNAVTGTISVGDGALVAELNETAWFGALGQSMGLLADPVTILGVSLVQTEFSGAGPDIAGYRLNVSSVVAPVVLGFAGSIATTAGAWTAFANGGASTLITTVAAVPLPQPLLLSFAALIGLSLVSLRRRAAAPVSRSSL